MQELTARCSVKGEWKERGNMARHGIELIAPPLDVGKVDVVFSVRRNRRAFGKLKVSQGRVEWMPAKKKDYAFEIGWADFDQLFEAEGKKVRTRSKN